jgi:DNA uptake protein ComE-like DNA-binding protein
MTTTLRTTQSLRTARSLRAAAAALAFALTLAACDAAPDAGTAGDADAAPAADTGMAAPGDAAASDAAATDETGPLLDPNQAAEAQLRGLGLDSAAVAALVEGRPWDSMIPVDQALAERMDSTARADLYRRMFIPLDLNTATEEEILLIPGVGPRMAHEFEEYRPYRGIEQFRREIGKYVDEQEVARLERYVTIR